MVNWFPVPEALVENEDFKSSTPAERVHFLWLVSEFNRRGGFYKADLEVAVTLGLSEDKVRRSRRKLQRLGWITTIPGRKAGGRNLATRYTDVRWAEARNSGGFYAQMHRFAFERMLDCICYKQFTHADVLAYVSLCYLRCRYDIDRTGNFFTAKRELRELTRLPDAPERVKTLYDGFQFTGGARLFEYQDEYHRLKFKKWNSFADPSEDEANRGSADSAQKNVKRRYEAKKAEKQRGHPGKMKDEPVDWFWQEVGHMPGSVQAERIRRLAKEHGRAKFERTVREWLAQASTDERVTRFFLRWCERRGVA